VSLTPDKWVETTLRDVTNYISRGKSPKYADFSKLPVVNQRAIRWHGIQAEHLKYIHPDQIDQWTSERFIQEGDVLWNSTGTGTIGRACLVQKAHLTPPKVVDSHVTIIRPNKEVIDPRYLFAWIRSPEIQKAIVDLSSGSTNQIELNRSTITEIHLPLAPLDEQKRIVDKLDALLARVDACRDRLDRVPLIFKRFRQTVLAVATSGALTEEWRVLKGDDAEWTEVDLGDVAEDFSYGSAAKSAKEGIIPVLRMGNIQNGQLDWDNLVFTSDPGEIKKYHLRAGDVLFNRTNSPELVGKTAVFKGEREAIYAGYLIRVRCGNKLHPDFLNYCLNSPAGRDYCWQVKSDGVSQSNINAKKLTAFPINLPPQNEQCEIVRRVETLFAFANRLEAFYTAGLEQVAQLTPSLLDKAFRGELVPQNPSEEPAEKLLKRIKERKANEPQQKRVSRTNKIKKERHMETKTVATLNELVSVLDELGGDATADRLIIESGLSDDIDRFFELLREGRNTLLDVPVGSNTPIRRIVDATQ
jgi:type I restriction enzyme S subunit